MIILILPNMMAVIKKTGQGIKNPKSRSYCLDVLSKCSGQTERKITHIIRGYLLGTLLISSNPYLEVWKNQQQSVRAVVPQMYAKAYGGNGSVLLPLVAVKNLLQSIATNLKCRTAKSVQCQKVQIDEIVKTKISAQKKITFYIVLIILSK